jgi:carboxyl-terminal processing protease
MKKISKKNLNIIINASMSLVLLLGVLAIGYYVGYNHKPEIDKIQNLSNKNTAVSTDADFAPFWKAWNILKTKSIYKNEINDQEKVWGAIEGLASSFGDPYTVFFNPENNKLFTEEIKGSFSGIGAELDIKNGMLTIVAPLKNTPAWNAGIKAGDKILKIDDKDTANMTADEAVSLIRGEIGTSVNLVIGREGEKSTKDLKITRDVVDYPIIETEYLEDKNIFIIRFYSFSENSTELFKEALNEFYNTGSNRLIIDLRNNPGGYLDSAVNIGSWFIEKGKVIVSEDYGNGEKGDSFRSRGPKLFNDDLNLVVLVNEGSASASEILAGALREYNIATLVGAQTFGKGSVQELVKITDDTSIKITVAHWLTPNGVSISEEGLKPDFEVPMTVEDIKNNKDPQLDKAIEIILK